MFETKLVRLECIPVFQILLVLVASVYDIVLIKSVMELIYEGFFVK